MRCQGSGRFETAAGSVSSRASASHRGTPRRTQPRAGCRSARPNVEDPFAEVSLSRQTGGYSNIIVALRSLTASRAGYMERKPTVKGRPQRVCAIGRVRPTTVAVIQEMAPNGRNSVPAQVHRMQAFSTPSGEECPEMSSWRRATRVASELSRSGRLTHTAGRGARPGAWPKCLPRVRHVRPPVKRRPRGRWPTRPRRRSRTSRRT